LRLSGGMIPSEESRGQDAVGGDPSSEAHPEKGPEKKKKKVRKRGEGKQIEEKGDRDHTRNIARGKGWEIGSRKI